MYKLPRGSMVHLIYELAGEHWVRVLNKDYGLRLGVPKHTSVDWYTWSIYPIEDYNNCWFAREFFCCLLEEPDGDVVGFLSGEFELISHIST